MKEIVHQCQRENPFAQKRLYDHYANKLYRLCRRYICNPLQTAIPKKNDRWKKPIVWGWAAAAVLLAGMLGGIWWVKQETGGIEKIAQGTPLTTKAIPRSVETPTSKEIAQGTPSITSSVPDRLTSPKISDADKGKHESQRRAQPIQQVPLRAIPPENEPETVAIQENLPPQPVIEVSKPLPEITASAVPEKPHYRVVHINEVRERKQQEAKARTRVAFRIGVPSSVPLTTPSGHGATLSIPIQN